MATKKTAAKKKAAKKPATKKAAGKKPASKKTAAKKPAAKKTAAKKPAAKKASAKGLAAQAKADAAQSSSHRDKNALYAKAINDPDFRQRLLEDPEGVLESEGIELDAGTIAQIRDSASKSPEALEEAIASSAREGGVGG